MNYKLLRYKLIFERVLISPFVIAGKMYAYMFPLKTKHDIVLFFSNADIGGGPQVNIDVTECIKDHHSPLIIFSKKPKNNQFIERFKLKGVRVIDLYQWIDNKSYHFVNCFFRGVIACWIKQQKIPVVLGGECLYFYKIIPHIPKEVRRVEICHLDTWMNYSVGFIRFISLRVFSTDYLKRIIEQQYTNHSIPSDYTKQLKFIENCIDISPLKEVENEILQVYFIGRGAPQKRVHLVAAIAKKVHELQLPVKFNFVGDVENIVKKEEYPYCQFYGNVNEERTMQKIYKEADVLLMTSLYEGLPMVIMQMMAHGKTIVSTAVNSIPDYIRDMENGLLIHSEDENDIIEEGSRHIITLLNNKVLRNDMGKRNHALALEKFSRTTFCKSYQQILFQ